MRPNLVLLGFSAVISGSQARSVAFRATKPPCFLLAGDSTTAVNGGWGDGFLSYLKDAAEGENRAKSGATTASFRNNNKWDDLIGSLESLVDDYEPIVTIQFGHNDQKDDSGITLEEYRENLIQFAREVGEADGTPVTSLSSPGILLAC